MNEKQPKQTNQQTNKQTKEQKNKKTNKKKLTSTSASPSPSLSQPPTIFPAYHTPPVLKPTSPSPLPFFLRAQNWGKRKFHLLADQNNDEILLFQGPWGRRERKKRDGRVRNGERWVGRRRVLPIKREQEQAFYIHLQLGKERLHTCCLSEKELEES